MPRQPRADIAEIPQHIVQRGNNRQICFFREHDYRRYLDYLLQAADRYRCHIHAYVLMTNHVHLLATPAEAGAVSRMMQLLGRRYVGYVNAYRERSGTLWEGRFRSCLVDTQEYLLTCYRYIELNPVRAGIAAGPGQYPWSSYHANALGRWNPVISPHPEYLSLGNTSVARSRAYRALFNDRIESERMDEIRRYLNQRKALGRSDFRRRIEDELGRPMTWRPAHRPGRKASG